ncbi:hypothetical protein J7T55_012521 [Diaporthe amygdali]|uniref:uncharacterized protein n=1 Tax=Phomopsis amygdali TaxID=1214568 RepID=UPI0022FF05D1|nr:uncharacterized protein J7T55_012521 [Diaporthe amygdali]KAJ0124048.1 hypothetical protein J7T55_012521 [Diaporthe amygdali]
MFGRSEPKFALLSSTSDEEAYGSPDAVDAHRTVLRDVARRSHDSRFWIATTILFASLSAIMGWNQITSMISRSYETESAVPHIRIKQQQFTGAVRIGADGTSFRSIDPDHTQYFGAPSPALDEAWANVTIGYDALLFDHQDAKTADGNLIRTVDKNGQSMMSLTVFHGLHCVNVIRKGLAGDYYKQPPGKDHLDHCLDFLRQIVQCQSDLTPFSYYWDERLKGPFPSFDDTHTCRDFDQIYEWASTKLLRH